MKILCLLLCNFVLSLSAHAGCMAPEAWARAFYKDQYNFYWNPNARSTDLMTSSFSALLQRELTNSKGQVGNLDYDPWLGAQDGAIGNPVQFHVESETPNLAMVSMVYPFVLGPAAKPKKHIIYFALRKEPMECWKLSDFITPLGDSLSNVFSQPQP